MTLVEQINALITAIGGPKPPAPGEIKSRLMEFSVAAQALEDQEASFQLELEKAGLTAQIKNLETEREELKTAMQAANVEIERFRAEQEQRNKRRPAKEEEVLSFLKPYEIDFLDVHGVAFVCDITVDKAHAILHRLCGDSTVAWTDGQDGKPMWYRLNAGGEYLYAHGLLK